MPAPLSECIAAFHEGKGWWCTPIINALDEAQHGLAFLWVKRCVRRLLRVIDSPKAETLLLDLDILEKMARDPPSREKLIEMAREIWYRPDRDPAQTAVANLYGAFADQLERRSRPVHAISMSSPINNFLFDWQTNAPNEANLEIVMTELRGLAGENNLII